MKDSAACQPTRNKILIIGAGLAGLSCAYELAKAKWTDYEIVIFEARNRSGGRVYTLRERFTEGLSAEAGAFWIHKGFKMVHSYLQELGLSQDLAPGGGILYHIKDKRFDDPFAPTAGVDGMLKYEMGLGALLGMSLGSHEREFGDPAALAWPPAELVARYGDMTFPEFLGIERTSQMGTFRLTGPARDFMRPFFNWWDDLDSTSALAVIRDGIISRIALDNNPQWSTLKHGMTQIPDRITQKLTEAQEKGKRITIEYRTSVTGIRQNASSVTVRCRDHSGKEFDQTGDFLVCAVPFSTLREIKDLPPDFSSGKKKAISRLQYAAVARIYLQFKKPFQLLRGGAGLTDRPFGNLLDMTMVQETILGGQKKSQRGRIIQAYLVGSQAREMSGKDDKERRSFLQSQLESTFPDPEDGIVGNEIVASDSVCWHEEQWSRGAYPTFTPEEFTSLKLSDMARPEGRVHFAGDHTSAYPGWMEGALESGQRVANEIAKRI